MPRTPSGTLPELFLTFLAPSFRPSLPRIHSGRRSLPTPKHAYKFNHEQCRCYSDAKDYDRAGSKSHIRRMSRIAARPASEANTADIWMPVASTSAVRIDSPFPSRPPPTTLPEPCIEANTTSSAVSALHDDRQSSRSELPSILRNLKTLSSQYPDKAPAEIISLARRQACREDEERGRTRAPPVPPPPIVLHPQPYSSDSQFFTPLLLQAMILGASALGLLTRRKVVHRENVERGESRRDLSAAKEEAEDRIDEVQALNLLVAAHAIAEPHVAETCSSSQWRDTLTKPLLRLVARAVEADRPMNLLGISSILHFIGPTSTPNCTGSFERARPLLAAQAFEAYRFLPILPVASPVDFQLETYTLSSILSLLYPRPQSTRETLGPSQRAILSHVSARILSSKCDFPPRLLLELAQAAARAKRLDIFTAVTRTSSTLPIALRLELAVKGLDLIASHQAWRHDRETVLRLAEFFAIIIQEVDSLSSAAIAHVDRGFYLLRSAFSIDRPLEPYISHSILSILTKNGPASALFETKKGRSLLADILKHLVRSRNPRLARQIVSAIPPDKLATAHLIPLLSSSHSATSQETWDFLLSHPSLVLTESAISARFSSLSHKSAVPSVLHTARRDWRLVRERGIEPSVKVWNKYLHVVVRFGGDRAVENVRLEMEKRGVEDNAWTHTILLQREMVRQDYQLRTRREGNRAIEQEKPISARPSCGDREVVRVNRRRGGQAQMRKLREAMREHQGKLGQGQNRAGESKVDITPILLLKSFTRWGRECDEPRLVQLAKVTIGIDLEARPVARQESTPTLSFSEEELCKIRIPAYKTLVSAFERRGRFDLAKVLRGRMREEQSSITRSRKDSRRI